MTDRVAAWAPDHVLEDAPTAAVVATHGLELAPGTILGEYRIDRALGEGGMGVVFAATHALIGKRAAIKVLKQELCAEPSNVERFIDEARVVNEIGHPNIVDIFAFGDTPDGRAYYVMEYLNGETLHDRIGRAPLAIEEIVDVVKPLARALDAAHAHGVIHRDLKPDNVFLVDVGDHAPNVKLLDFGIAKLARRRLSAGVPAADALVEQTAAGAMIGTPQYIAPEQAKGYAIDHRADIYALGGIVFELLTGRPPFEADNPIELVAKHLMEQPVRPSSLAAGVSHELDELVLAMLAKDPSRRPSLGEVATVLERQRQRRSSRGSTPIAPVPTPNPLMFAALSGNRLRPVAAPRAAVLDDAATLRSDRSAARPPAASPAVTVPAGRRRRGSRIAVVVALVAGAAIGGFALTGAWPRDAGTGAAPAAAPPTGRLQLVIAGARSPEILIDGAPARDDVELTLGKHHVEIRAAGMVTHHLDVAITSLATVHHITLVAAPRGGSSATDP